MLNNELPNAIDHASHIVLIVIRFKGLYPVRRIVASI